MTRQGNALTSIAARWIAAAALLILLLPLAGRAEEPKKIIYGFDREFPPFSFDGEQGAPAGFDVDLLQAVLRDQNVALDIRPMTWDKVQSALAGGDIQITSGMAKTQQRLLLFLFSDQPTAPLNVKLFTKNYNRVGNAIQLRGKTVAVEKGSLYQRILEQFGGLNIKLYKDKIEAIKALYNEETFALGDADKTVYYYLKKLNLGGISAVGTPLHVTESYFAVNNEQTDLLKMVNEGMRRVMEDGEYDRIYRKWFVEEVTAGERQKMLQAAGEAAINSYAPYSQQARGAAVLAQSGQIYAGCVIENSLPALNVSALQVALWKAVSNGETEIRAAVSLSPDGTAMPPTATERQALYEFGRGVLAIIEPIKGEYQTQMVSQLLPTLTVPSPKEPAL